MLKKTITSYLLFLVILLSLSGIVYASVDKDSSNIDSKGAISLENSLISEETTGSKTETLFNKERIDSKDTTDADKITEKSSETKLAKAKTTKDKKTSSNKEATTQSSTVSAAASSTGRPPSVEIVPVGNAGAAATSIPIEVPPGRKGLAPNLLLNYNSNNRNGWIGVGWNLDMGDIRKSGKENVSYAYALNGSPADLVERPDWGSGYYSAKIESGFTKYYYDSSTDSWEVTTKDGTKYYYGSTSSSRQQDTDGTYKWCLDRVEDINGNYMEIFYTNDQGEIYLDRIDYTGGSDLAPSNYVKFSLESRTDITTLYTLGLQVVTAYRLKTIEVFANDQLVRKYVLDYTYSPNTIRSLLSSVTIYGSDGVSTLPLITYSYQTTADSFQYVGSTAVTFGGYPKWAGDFNGDGKIDFITCNGEIFHSLGTEFILVGVWGAFECSGHSNVVGDFNGDGKDDMLVHELGASYPDVDLYISTGTSFQYISTSPIWSGETLEVAGDFNGDGKADFVTNTGSIFYSDGSQFLYGGNKDAFSSPTIFAGEFDFNGDGKDDILLSLNGSPDVSIYICRGDSFEATASICCPVPVVAGDFNGDRMTDFIDSLKDIYFSSGSGFNGPVASQGLPALNQPRGGDFNGDGKDDLLVYNDTAVAVELYLSTGSIPDLLSTVENGFGSTTSISYAPSTQYNNTFLPFVVQTLSSVTIDDGNGILSTTTYEYSGGYYDYDDREFRGFEYVKAVLPNGTYTETWYLQDDIFKGLPDEQITRDSSGDIYTKTENTYESSSPYTGVDFPYLKQKDDYVYDGTATPKQARTDFEYDSYGNITRKYLYGDVSITGDERDEYIEYNYDLTNWIVSLPSTTYVKDNIGTIKVQTWFTYYSGMGNLWKEESWLDTGANPVTTYTYDSYGNVETITDPKNNPPTIITYDTTTHTYPEVATNPLGHTVQKTYDYRFGKVLTETDPNGNVSTYDYDVFGRIKKVTNPNDTASTYGTMSYFYMDFGTVGNQRVVTYATEQSGTANYIWTETYFDGLGRTIKTRAEGPDSKVIAAQTIYDNRGLVDSKSLPYFEVTETPRWTSYEYDPIGRVKKTTLPDGTYATASYLKGTLTYIDPNGHQKVEVKDIYGRIISIEEYTGVSPSFALYATTTYQYDLLGNLSYVKDEAGNETFIYYDSLSRKTSMDDPDMGFWTYEYDVNGNLIYQKDAKLQEITFEYDEINRIKKKIYPDATFIEYKYDELTSTNSTGRLTTLTNASATTKFYYNKLGQTTKSIKTIDSIDYTTETTYDALGRIVTITYPDTTVIKYVYNLGGNLYQVTDSSGATVYAEYTGYNAMGQVAAINYGNNVSTGYTYDALNNRLRTINTTSPTAGTLINLSYDQYDNVGNITQITDLIDSNKTRTFVYDDLNRLIEANSTSYGGKLIYQYDKIGNMTYNCRYGYYYYEDPNHPHAVTRIEKDGTTIDNYTYDANGNMESGAGRSFTYDEDNRPTSIVYNSKATISTYDASGIRVKKTTPTATTIYIGDLYECTNGNCTKYIFAGSQRIAKLDNTDTYYYHSDHLGSSSVITDSIGNSAQQLYYYPYGEIKTNTGSDITKHKFTDQEYDAETGLYYYGARYYDPKLARFISADTIVPDPRNPQSLNRYSYVINNPLSYIDPTGHGFWKTLLGVVEVVVGAVITIAASLTGNYYVAAVGIALMAHGVETLGGNVNISTSTQVASFGGGGGGGGGGPGGDYGGGGGYTNYNELYNNLYTDSGQIVSDAGMYGNLYGNKFNRFMEFLSKQRINRGAFDPWIFEKIADSWNQLPKSIRTYEPKSWWGQIVDDMGNHAGNQQRLPGGYHLTVDEGGVVWVHKDFHDPLKGISETINHWSELKIKEYIEQDVSSDWNMYR